MLFTIVLYIVAELYLSGLTYWIINDILILYIYVENCDFMQIYIIVALICVYDLNLIYCYILYYNSLKLKL